MYRLYFVYSEFSYMELQVAALVPLTLLLVSEARCAPIIVAHLNEYYDIEKCITAPTQHICRMTKLVTNEECHMTGHCNGNSGAYTLYVQGR